MYLSMCVFVCVYIIYVYVYMCICMCVCIYTCMCVYVYVNEWFYNILRAIFYSRISRILRMSNTTNITHGSIYVCMYVCTFCLILNSWIHITWSPAFWPFPWFQTKQNASSSFLWLNSMEHPSSSAGHGSNSCRNRICAAAIEFMAMDPPPPLLLLHPPLSSPSSHVSPSACDFFDDDDDHHHRNHPPVVSVAHINLSLSSSLDALRKHEDLAYSSLMNEVRSCSSRLSKRLKVVLSPIHSSLISSIHSKNPCLTVFSFI